MSDDPSMIVTWAVPLLAAVAGYGSGLSQLKEHDRRLDEFDEDVNTLTTDFHKHKTEVVDRLARMETKIDIILQR